MIKINFFNKRQPGLVTVLISSYNYGHFITDALNSLNSQSYKEIELIVLDDCSTDNTQGIVKEWRGGHKNSFRNFIYFRLPRRLPPEWVLNIGFIMAEGEYILIHDADDISREDKIEKQVNCLEDHPETAVVGSKYQDFIENRERIIGYSLWVSVDRLEIIRRYQETPYPCVCFGTIMFRTSILNKIIACRPVPGGFGDYDFIKRIVNNNFIIDNIDEYLFYVRNHPAQTTRKKESVPLELFPDNIANSRGVSAIIAVSGDLKNTKSIIKRLFREYSDLEVILLGDQFNNIGEIESSIDIDTEIVDQAGKRELLVVKVPGRVIYPGLYLIALLFVRKARVKLYNFNQIEDYSSLDIIKKFINMAGIDNKFASLSGIEFFE